MPNGCRGGLPAARDSTIFAKCRMAVGAACQPPAGSYDATVAASTAGVVYIDSPMPLCENRHRLTLNGKRMVEAKTIVVEYYAVLREERGQSREVITTQAQTPRELYDELQQRFRFSLPSQRLGVAVNDEFQGWDSLLKSDDKVVFIPPVAGG